MSSEWKGLVLLVATLGAVLVSQVSCGPATAQVETPDEEQRTVSVSGSGTVSAAPDEVVLRLGVETMAETASEALAQNSEQMEAVIAALTEAGVPEENVQTQTVQLRPRYEQPPRETGPAQEGE